MGKGDVAETAGGVRGRQRIAVDGQLRHFAARPRALRDTHWRTFDPKPRRAHSGDSRHAGGPIRILSGPPAVAAAVALELPEHPLVLIDGWRDESPWVSKAMERAGGVVEIGAMGELPGGHPLGSALPGWSYRALPSSRSPKKPSAPSD